MKLEFSDLPSQLHFIASGLKCDEPISSAFPHLSQSSGFSSQFVEPFWCLHSALCWAWLAYHGGVSVEMIRSTVRQIVQRSVTAAKTAGGNNMQDYHDAACMIAATLVDRETALQAAFIVEHANPEAENYQFYQAFAGILKFRILKQPEMELAQLQVLLRKKATSMFAGVPHKLATAFVERDWERFNTTIQQEFAKEWRRAEREKTISTSRRGEVCVTLKGRGLSHYWPWGQAALAKLALLEGVEVLCDDLWLPRGLLVSS